MGQEAHICCYFGRTDVCIPAAARDLNHINCPAQHVHAHKKGWPLNTRQVVSPILQTWPALEVLKDDLVCCACRAVAVCYYLPIQNIEGVGHDAGQDKL